MKINEKNFVKTPCISWIVHTPEGYLRIRNSEDNKDYELFYGKVGENEFMYFKLEDGTPKIISHRKDISKLYEFIIKISPEGFEQKKETEN